MERSDATLETFETVRRRMLPYGALAVMVLAFFWDSFFAHKIMLMRDTFCDCFPWRMFARAAYRSGHLPLWNPYSACGQPFAACPQAGIFYPLHALFIFLPPVFALKLWMALHLFIGAASMCLLLRHWRLERAPALVGGIAFGLGTYPVGMMEFQATLPPIVLSPLALLLSDKLLEAAAPGAKWRRRWALASGLALVLGAQYLAGYPQTLMNSLIIMAIYLGARCAVRRNGKEALRGVGLLAGAGVLAAGLCAAQLLMTLEMLPLSDRASFIDPDMDFASLHPVWLLGMIFPFIGGHPGYLGQWLGQERGIWEFWIGTAYIGIVPLVLATAALGCLRGGSGPRRGEGVSLCFLVATFLGITIFGLLMAMGKYFPLYIFFYKHVPLFGQMRWPSKFLQLVVFGACVMAGVGFQRLIDGRRNGRAGGKAWAWGWLGAFCVLAGMAANAHRRPDFFAWLMNQTKPGAARPEILAGIAAESEKAVAFLAVGLAIVVPWGMGWGTRSGRGRGRIGDSPRADIPLGTVPNPLGTVPIVLIVLAAFGDLFVTGREVHPIVEDTVYASRPDELMAGVSREGCWRVATDYADELQQALYGVGDVKRFEFARRWLVGETPVPDGIFRIHGGDAVRIEEFMEFKGIAAQNPEARERALDLLNVRVAVSGPPLFQVLTGALPAVLTFEERRGSLPRALVAGNWRVARVKQNMLNTLFSSDFDPYRTVVLEEAPEGWPAEKMDGPRPGTPPATAAEAGVESIRYDWNRVDLKARAQKDAILLLNDLYYPGWEATVDGRPEPIMKANWIFRAVALRPGRHEVSFVYRPARVRVGLAISLLTLAVMGAGLLLKRGKRT